MTEHLLTGRIGANPHLLLHEEVLAPQFNYEVEHLLPWYVAIEKVLALEYRRMELISAEETALIGEALHGISAATLTADPDHNMSDIAFALERHVESRLPSPVVAWHADRSRNDLQSCAQVMFVRHQLTLTAQALLALYGAAHRLANDSVDLLMPGYTHSQAAQVITAGYWLSAFSEEVLQVLGRLLATYDDINYSPLGAGAMAGQELAWDRERAARLLGFTGPRTHALIAVASRHWALQATSELSLFGVTLSRFVTDLITWSSSEYGFIDLPDAYAGISSAMPQKKNFPLLERIRGRTAHLSAYHLDVLTCQRNTPYSNSVEVSKEAGSHVLSAFQAARSIVALMTGVLENLMFRGDRMLAVCEREFLGGFTLANRLTLDEGVPWRTAQVVAGEYILAAIEQGAAPRDVRPELLRRIASARGHKLANPQRALAVASDVRGSIELKCSSGSTRPDEVRRMLAHQAERRREVAAAWEERRQRVYEGIVETDRLLGLVTPTGSISEGRSTP